MTRECHVRFCERLGVRLPGATLPPGTLEHVVFLSDLWVGAISGFLIGGRPRE